MAHEFVLNAPIPGVTTINSMFTEEDRKYLESIGSPIQDSPQSARLSRSGGLPLPTFNESMEDKGTCGCTKGKGDDECDDLKRKLEDAAPQAEESFFPSDSFAQKNDRGHDGPQYAENAAADQLAPWDLRQSAGHAKLNSSPPPHVTQNMQRVRRTGGLPLPS